jgi:actin-like ATPase involved in cell morphogenesis
MVSDGEIREALKPIVDVIVGAVRDALERIPRSSPRTSSTTASS